LYLAGSLHPPYFGYNKLEKSLSPGEELKIILLYEIENVGGFYIFTIESDTYTSTGVYKDKIEGAMPFYARVIVRAGNQKAEGFFILDIDEDSKLFTIKIIKRYSIPFKIKES